MPGRWNPHPTDPSPRSRRDTLNELGEFVRWLVRPTSATTEAVTTDRRLPRRLRRSRANTR